MKAIEKQFRQGLEVLAIDFEDRHVSASLELIENLLKWNKKINLTAIKNPSDAVTKHLLDSIALLPLVKALQRNTNDDDTHPFSVLDVGTGAGFPGLPLALFTPNINYTLVDSNNKKISFIRRMTTLLNLSNVEAVHSRIQDIKSEAPFNIITARAFADVNDLLNWLPEVYDENTQVLAMKGKLPEEELSTLKAGLLASQWELLEIVALEVPNLDAERCVLRLSPVNTDAA